MSVLLKDAPAQFQAAVVTISEVDLIGSSGDVVLTTTPTTTNLLTLAHDVASLVNGAVVPAGTYTQLRFVITGGYVEVNGSIYASSPTYAGLPAGASIAGTLQMPSYGQSGLKVDLLNGGIAVGTDAKILVVDFDVSQSFGQAAGGSGAWVMHPVLHASDVQLTGSVNVRLALAQGSTLPVGVSVADFQAVLEAPGATSGVPVALTAAGDGTATVTFQYLVPGDYSVSFVAPAALASFTTDPVTPATVTVSSGQATPAAFSLTVPPPSPL